MSTVSIEPADQGGGEAGVGEAVPPSWAVEPPALADGSLLADGIAG